MQGGDGRVEWVISRYHNAMKKSGQFEGAQIEGLDLCTPKKIPHTPPVTGGKTMGERVTARNTTGVGGRNVPADTLRHPFGTHQEGAVGLIVRAPVHLAVVRLEFL